MAAIVFPSSPSVGDTYQVGTKIWQYDGTVWKAISSSSGTGTGMGTITDLTETATLSSWGSISAGAISSKTITIAGMVGGDAVVPIIPLTLEAGLIPFVKAISGGATFYLYNSTGSPISPADNQTFGVMGLRRNT